MASASRDTEWVGNPQFLLGQERWGISGSGSRGGERRVGVSASARQPSV